jgi:hypothetical protein
MDSLLGALNSSARQKPVIFRRPESWTNNISLNASLSHDEQLSMQFSNPTERIKEVPPKASMNHGETSREDLSYDEHFSATQMRESALVRRHQSANPSTSFDRVTADSENFSEANRISRKYSKHEDKTIPDIQRQPGMRERPERVSSFSSVSGYPRRSVASEVAHPSVLGEQDAVPKAEGIDMHLSSSTSRIEVPGSLPHDAGEGTKMEAAEATEQKGEAEAEGGEKEDVTLGAEEDVENVMKVLTKTIADLKGVIADEVAAALRHNTDQVATEVERRVDVELRDRLAKSGFQPRMIDTVVGSGDGTGATGNRSHLSCTRIPFNQLEADTLQYYHLEYARDILDPNFWMIFRSLGPDETGPMFEHTRRLRARWKHRASSPTSPNSHPDSRAGDEVGNRSGQQ